MREPQVVRTGGVNQIFQHNGNAVEQPTILSSAQFAFGLMGRGQRHVGGHRDKDIEDWVVLGNARQGALSHSDR